MITHATLEDVFAGKLPGRSIGILSVPESYVTAALNLSQGGRMAFWFALDPLAWTGKSRPGYILEGAA